jgi:uncharacterized membrane protein YfcA
MYSQQELDDAVASGVITADAAAALRGHVEQQRSTQIADEEQFRLLTGFNDIFVSIAAAIMLFAMGWIGQWVGQQAGLTIDVDGPSPLAPLFVAVTSWALALFFTAKRRMALPSILLLLTFVGGVLVTAAFSLILGIGPDHFDDNPQLGGVIGSVAAAIAAGGAWLHWRRFHVPITIAAGAASVAAIAVGLLVAALGQNIEDAKNLVLGFVLLLGVGVFLFAMWWDSSDRARVTRRSDVAFWLHLLAAPMIAHPIFALLGLTEGHVSAGGAALVVLLYVLFGLVALAVDRRALLVSALAYVLYALDSLFRDYGAVELSVAFTALIIGSALLLLSAFWTSARRTIVRPLPDGLSSRLPVLDRIPVPAAA